MAQDSKRKRRERRLRRDRNIALKMAQVAIFQREQAKTIANHLAGELGKSRTPGYEIKKVEEPVDGTEPVAAENVSPEASGPNEDSSGLEVPQSEVLGV